MEDGDGRRTVHRRQKETDRSSFLGALRDADMGEDFFGSPLAQVLLIRRVLAICLTSDLTSSESDN